MTATKENTKTANSTVKANTYGLMGRATKASSFKVQDTAKAAGNRQNLTEISTLALTRQTKRTVTVAMFGRMDACFREGLPTM